MMEVKRQYWSCSGETVLKKNQFDQDSALARGANRLLQEQQIIQSNQQLSQMLQPSPLQQATRAPLPAPLAWLNQTLQTLAKPVVVLAQWIQHLPQQLGQTVLHVAQQTAQRMERAVSQILSFFFGEKKDKTEEKEQRERNDAGLLDIFGDDPLGSNKVQKKEKSGLGAGG